MLSLTQTRTGRWLLAASFGLVVCLVGALVVVALTRGADEPVCSPAPPVSSELLCTTEYAGYALSDALQGRLARPEADQYLQRWPQSLATRFMSDSAMFRFSNATARQALLYPVLARLVKAEPLPEAYDAIHFGQHCCVVHLQVTDETASTPPEAIIERLGSRGMRRDSCGHVYLIAEAPSGSGICSAASRFHVDAMLKELCAHGFVTTARLGQTPDESFTLMSRARASISCDASLEALVDGLRSYLDRSP